MIIKDFFPSEAVGEFVQCYRIVHFTFDSAEQIPCKAYPPKPENCLHFFLHDPLLIERDDGIKTQPSILFRGQQTSVVRQRAGKDFIDVQIVFQPTAVFRLIGMPAQELVNMRLDADCLFKKDIHFILEQLQEANDYTEMIRIVECYTKSLIAHARKDYLPLDRISEWLVKKNAVASIDTLAKEAFYSTKQFKRKFAERVGLNPKLYSRIVRFNKTYNFKNRFPGKEWSVIASECGYADYQHLAKDYKEFTGFTPPQFHVLESGAPENVLGLARHLYVSRYKAMQ